MKHTKLYKIIIAILISTTVIASCINPDYFTVYSGKNLVAHKLLSDWSTNQSTVYMNYAPVSAAVAGTTGLPDSSALIYRLENKNLMPNGDFEATAIDAVPAGWTAPMGGTHQVKNTVHHLSGKALLFNQAATEYLSFNLNSLSDTALINCSYVFRFRLEGNSSQAFDFEIEDTSTSGNIIKYYPNITAIGQGYSVPDDFNEVPLTDFLIHSGDSEVFRINFKTSGTPQIGYIDDLRIIKSDQAQHLIAELPYADPGRVDSLQLISGTYRFSIYVKADPETASTNNSFNSNAVTLKIEAIDPDGSGGSSKYQSFSAADNSSFSDWTKIYIDTPLQINIPADTSSTVIRLSVSPCDTSGGSMSIDAGSILISNPQLLFSESGTF